MPYVEGDEFYSDWVLNSYYESWFDYRARRVRQRADQRAAELAKRERLVQQAAQNARQIARQRAIKLEKYRQQRTEWKARVKREAEADIAAARRRCTLTREDALALSPEDEYALDFTSLRRLAPELAESIRWLSGAMI